MAQSSGMPRPTWANLESGAANPTLAVLIKVANALQVSIEELVAPPRASARFFPAASLPVKQRGTVSIRKLLPEPISGLEIDRMELPPGGAMTGIPHTPGTREYLTCEVGTIELTAEAMRRIRGRAPRLLVCGLNPHAGEHGLFGDREEERIIVPAIEAARSKGIDVRGRLPPVEPVVAPGGVDQSSIRRTCASASPSEWVIVSSERRAPIAVKRRAAPPDNRSCGGPPWRNTSMSFHSTPREWPVPSAFIAASLAANRAARLGTGSRRRVQYAISPPVDPPRRKPPP
jgi:transcriptional regulator with XRE-family HTH domain